MPEPAEAAPAPEPSAPDRFERTIDIDGESWIAYSSGRGAYGTGRCGLASVEAVHFALAAEPGEPLYEALAPVRHLQHMFDRELEALFRGARRIVKPEPGASAPRSRRFGLSDE